MALKQNKEKQISDGYAAARPNEASMLCGSML